MHDRGWSAVGRTIVATSEISEEPPGGNRGVLLLGLSARHCSPPDGAAEGGYVRVVPPDSGPLPKE